VGDSRADLKGEKNSKNTAKGRRIIGNGTTLSLWGESFKHVPGATEITKVGGVVGFNTLLLDLGNWNDAATQETLPGKKGCWAALVQTRRGLKFLRASKKE